MSLDAPTMPLRWRVWCRAFGIACLVHLTLPDAHRLSWLVPNVAFAVAALSLLAPPTPGTPRFRLTFATLAIAKAIPLVLLGDQLTQSVVLMLGALAALGLARPDDDRTHAHALRLLTLGVYGLAAFHKTNRDFLDPAVSCATGGMALLAENWSLPIAPDLFGSAWPPLFLATEAALVVLALWRPAGALAIAIAMHVPLTIVFAPAFAWVMLPGWVAFLRDEDLAHVLTTWRSRRRLVLAVGLAPATLSALLYFRDHWIPYPAWQLVELSLWLLLGLYVVALATRTQGALVGRLAWTEPSSRLAASVPLVVLLANGATPYLGLQFHHAAAMLSNLRVDEGCWNHLVVPESVRLRDPYVRIEAMHVGPDVPGPDALVAHARETLWHPASLAEGITRWCRAGAAPLTLELRYDGRTIRTDDACARPPELPWQPSGLFQTNLPRRCPERCIH